MQGPNRHRGQNQRKKPPQQAVSWAKARIRPSEDTEFVAQGQRLEQEISTRGLSGSDRGTGPADRSHRLVACRPRTLTSMILVRRNIGEAQVRGFGNHASKDWFLSHSEQGER